MFVDFSLLLNTLYFSNSQLRKESLLRTYFTKTSDPDRGYALASLAGTLKLPLYRRARVKALLVEQVDAMLFDLSYDYVGELAETIAHLWPRKKSSICVAELTLTDIVRVFQGEDISASNQFLSECLNVMSYEERWSFLKFLGSSMRVGLSLRSCKHVLAQYGSKDIQDIEKIWHGVSPPYVNLFAWLEGRHAVDLQVSDLHFTPVMLAHPLREETMDDFDWAKWQVEWKYDGIRVQYVQDAEGQWRLYSRTGEDISHSFPDLGLLHQYSIALDGELLVGTTQAINDFNALQQRLGKSKPSKKLMQQYPVLFMAYDILRFQEDSYLSSPLKRRREFLQARVATASSERLLLSPVQSCQSQEDLFKAKASSKAYALAPVEGLMIKRLDSIYQSGRPTGKWWKLKRDPCYIDAVLVYAQRGHGKRSSLYSDYTFAVWQGKDLVPVGKAYSGFTDDELKKLDLWVRKHTIAQFGPMRQLEPTLVVEVAFDCVMQSPRRRAGLSLRFPRIHRIRWDKPADEADHLTTVADLQ